MRATPKAHFSELAACVAGGNFFGVDSLTRRVRAWPGDFSREFPSGPTPLAATLPGK